MKRIGITNLVLIIDSVSKKKVNPDKPTTNKMKTCVLMMDHTNNWFIGKLYYIMIKVNLKKEKENDQGYDV